MKQLMNLFVKILPSETAYAHCDLPCGIYDPHQAQLAAHTVIRMTQILHDAHAEEDDDKKLMHDVTRATKIKEEHAEIVKHEVRVLWADYFKPEHLEQYPDLHAKVFAIMKAASKARQNIDSDAANDLLAKVQEFAEIFWKTKGRETVRVASGYPTGGEVVLPK